MSQLFHSAQAGLSAPASQPVGQAWKVKEPPASAVKVPINCRKFNRIKTNDGLNLKQTKTVTKNSQT